MLGATLLLASFAFLLTIIALWPRKEQKRRISSPESES